MAQDCLQAVCQPTKIYGDSSACHLAVQNWTMMLNISYRPFVNGDGVKPSVHVWAKLPVYVQSVLPARFRVILMNVSSRQFMASDGVILAVDVWAKLPINVQLILPARFQVILTNVSLRQFVASDGLILAVHVWAKL